MRKLQIFAIATTLLLLAAGVGCTGFFVNPTLTGITVGPTATIQQSKTVQMTATGTYNDGSTKTLTSGVFWSSDTQSIATVNSSTGLVTGVGPGQATITGASGTQTGTATITVTLAGITSITVTPANGNVTVGNPQKFTAFANGTTEDISSSVTWTLNPAVTGASFATDGTLSTSGISITGPTTVQVVATDPTSGVSGHTNVTINP
jgi:hypothetical protein